MSFLSPFISRHRPWLPTALTAGAVTWLLLTRLAAWRTSTALLAGWDVGVLAYLAVLGRSMLSWEPQRARARAEALDEGRWTVLLVTLGAVLVSLVAVALDLAGSKGTSPWAAALAMATVLLSWCFTHVIFANHYRHEHLLRGGLDFPGNKGEPDLLEFFYLSFTVGMTAQVSDVTTNSAAMRRLVLAHGLVSFVFNTAVVAGTVNIAAGLAS
ncbi:DUF1345 domain-containing protein [Roseomonas elaeocarpi]|uniref:DUF1345 domain-containing protein n=1 Tax=Roseomonas elaeocarpi TaxID=907779 RepID=A0ABV6JQX9_9PROT